MSLRCSCQQAAAVTCAACSMRFMCLPSCPLTPLSSHPPAILKTLPCQIDAPSTAVPAAMRMHAVAAVPSSPGGGRCCCMR